MVETQIKQRGVTDPRVLEAMERVPRHRFVVAGHERHAHDDTALPLEAGQSISQPYIVAAMTEALEPKPSDRILEVGTGSGYQTAVLAEIVDKVYTIERIAVLSRTARQLLDDLGYTDIEYRVADGAQGWPEEAPFDGILVTAGAERLPERLLEQLSDGGCLVIPIGGRIDQDLYQIRRSGSRFEDRFITRCRFVPLVEEREGPAE
ncbi:MAG: protein-L-isoaspartate(D-aspartate) O-methyltransferase [Gemmatimonadetes bacterium]|uniref:Protein-L-isoaspartate O-methyltransferase n=1 Tax=Candidatus Kutchimonas denitrificans TaxID=3056748 RepID=A0AAE4ZCJ2_9BACT|nr:protein-L-isoaspartate(D-aspartate) O-methyltransferase [Gemmatimonadota bacterium]NIR76016.1 protein-L-isoaspartate(D-aspartate) O-methyltransferase [Candidatus Kutchimonas denitrificans]NIS02208.1 protein-L-isoaspartate(D-aspartate) O-methyltransferase [Gemmatimonadota bacterium]NIT68034.1 protein-L-isoaspartate(D-aspartate) O-methyltransferase [Gemmatimonadota bacterium]NIU54060.1 protein-L-isoaspartate(D-aspartate) O-methyltransferase [Gemmatimonadota bacterium]